MLVIILRTKVFLDVKFHPKWILGGYLQVLQSNICMVDHGGANPSNELSKQNFICLKSNNYSNTRLNIFCHLQPTCWCGQHQLSPPPLWHRLYTCKLREWIHPTNPGLSTKSSGESPCFVAQRFQTPTPKKKNLQRCLICVGNHWNFGTQPVDDAWLQSQQLPRFTHSLLLRGKKQSNVSLVKVCVTSSC